MDMIKSGQMLGWGRPIHQEFCQTEQKLIALVNKYWDELPLHVSFPSRYNKEKRVTEYFIDRIWFDHDGHGKPINAFMDYRRIESFAYQLGGEAGGIATEDGVHSHLYITPEWTSDLLHIVELKRKLIQHLALRTVDWGALDISKLPRLPNSRISSTSPLYSVQIYPGEFWADVREAQKARRKFYKRRCDISLDTLANALRYTNPAPRPITAIEQANMDVNGVTIKPVTQVFEKECLRRYMSLPNPPAYMRWLATVQLKKKGFSPSLAVQFFKALQMDDFDENKTIYFVNKAFDYSWSASCNTIEARGFCIGECCPFFNKKTGGTQGDIDLD